MATTSMQIKLVQNGLVKFVATNAAGASVVIDGHAEMGGENAGLRPMEMLLSALAGCGAMDVIHIMKEQRQNLERLGVDVGGRTGRHHSRSITTTPSPRIAARGKRLTR